MRFWILLILFIFMTSSAQAAVILKEIYYKDGDTALNGTLAYDSEENNLKKPGILIFPEWWGNNDYIKKRAREMAELGYIAFVADMYGVDKVTTKAKIAEEWSKPFYEDRVLMRRRARTGLDILKQHRNVDKSNIAAIGFCMGGTVAIELARLGLNLKGVAAFHSGLKFPDSVKNTKIRAKILVMNGAADPFVPFSEQQAFIEEMQEAETDLQFIQYSGAKHAFTNPSANKFHIPGVEYNAKAERRSLEALQLFLTEIFTR